jgi:hypothetical protein
MTTINKCKACTCVYNDIIYGLAKCSLDEVEINEFGSCDSYIMIKRDMGWDTQND